MIDEATLLSLLDAHAPFAPCAHAPRLSAWHTDDELPLWQALEAHARAPVDTPYFAIAWPSAQVVAQALLDRRIDVRGKTVADIGCGSGLVACAAMLAGATRAIAVDVDGLAVAAARALAERHGVVVEPAAFDALADPARVLADVILCADLVSRAAQQARFCAAVDAWRARGASVWLADSGRPFFHPHGTPLAFEAQVATTSRVDGVGARVVRVFGPATGCR